MGAREIDLNEVPAINIVQARLTAIDPGLSVAQAGHDFDRGTYTLVVAGQGERAVSHFPGNFSMTCATIARHLAAAIRRNCRHGLPTRLERSSRVTV